MFRLTWNRKAAPWIALLGAAVLAAGVVLLLTANGGWKETQAVVVHIDETVLDRGAANERTVYTAFVDYTVDGVAYHEVDLGGSAPEYRKGKTVTVLYDPADPGAAKSKGDSGPGIPLIGVGILFFALALPNWLLGKKKK